MSYYERDIPRERESDAVSANTIVDSNLNDYCLHNTHVFAIIVAEVTNQHAYKALKD